jgi:hypothetical protein
VGGGLLPFVALSGGSVLMDGAHAALFHFPLVAYGAVILSFVGALHWGIALSHPAASLRDRKVMIGWSVVARSAWLGSHAADAGARSAGACDGVLGAPGL